VRCVQLLNEFRFVYNSYEIRKAFKPRMGFVCVKHTMTLTIVAVHFLANFHRKEKKLKDFL